MRKISAEWGVSDGLSIKYCELVPTIYHGETNRNAALRKATFSRWVDGVSNARLVMLPGPESMQAGGLIVRLWQSQPKYQELFYDVPPLVEQ